MFQLLSVFKSFAEYLPFLKWQTIIMKRVADWSSVDRQHLHVLSALFKKADFVVCLPYFQRQQDEMLYLRGWLLADGLLFLLYYVVMPVEPEPEPVYSSLSSICKSRGTGRRLNQQRVRIKGKNRATGGGVDQRLRLTFYMRIVETLWRLKQMQMS